MPESKRVFSPAKVNLFLGVTGKRSDGFHEIVSIVSKVGFGDMMRISVGGKRENDRLVCNMKALDCGPDNLIRKAADSFREAAHLDFGVCVELDKVIPVGAGLGGGSSNAATTLIALNDLCGHPLNESVLRKVATTLGSDVPLFLRKGPVMIRGRGEEVTELPVSLTERIAGRRILIFAPEYTISTKWAYARMAERRENYASADLVEAKLSGWSRKTSTWKEILYNSFEGVIFRKFPGLPTLVRELEREFDIPCLLSGSGSACFAILRSDSPVDLIYRGIQEGWGDEAFIVEGRLETPCN